MKCFRNILIITLTTLFLSVFSHAQEKDKTLLKADKEAKSLVYNGNELLEQDDFVSAEMEFRKAISEQPENVVGAYNLGKSYYDRGDYGEALYRHQQALKNAKSKKEKHYAFHNIGNILMKEKKCKEATEAFKSALKNDPTDDETRYNYVLAKECAEEQQKQQDQNKDNQDKEEDKDNKDQENKDKEGDQEKDQQDQNKEDKKEGDKDKDKEGDQKEDEKQNPDKKDQDKEGKQDQKKPPKQKPGQLSPQQVKNLLEAMNAQEQKVQEKINAEKQKGIKIKTEKDW